MKRNKVLSRFLLTFFAVLGTSWFLIGAIYEKAGFYAGLSAGAGYSARKFSESVSVPLHTYSCHDNSICGFEEDFGGFVGYVMPLSKKDWWVGMEFGIEKPFYKKHFLPSLNCDDVPMLHPIENLSHRVKTMYAAKLHAKIGKVFNEKWFVYGLTGIDIRRTEIFVKSPPAIDVCSKKFLLGFAVGLGIEREINENWHFGVEVVNTYYPSKTFKFEDDFHFSSKIKTNLTQLALRLIYNF